MLLSAWVQLIIDVISQGFPIFSLKSHSNLLHLLRIRAQVSFGHLTPLQRLSTIRIDVAAESLSPADPSSTTQWRGFRHKFALHTCTKGIGKLTDLRRVLAGIESLFSNGPSFTRGAWCSLRSWGRQCVSYNVGERVSRGRAEGWVVLRGSTHSNDSTRQRAPREKCVNTRKVTLWLLAVRMRSYCFHFSTHTGKVVEWNE